MECLWEAPTAFLVSMAASGARHLASKCPRKELGWRGTGSVPGRQLCAGMAWGCCLHALLHAIHCLGLGWSQQPAWGESSSVDGWTH